MCTLFTFAYYWKYFLLFEYRIEKNWLNNTGWIQITLAIRGTSYNILWVKIINNDTILFSFLSSKKRSINIWILHIFWLILDLSYLAEKGVLSVELVESVLSRPPGVDVFLGTPDPNPMGPGLICLWPDLMLEVLLTPEPRLPSSSELRLRLEPCLLGGLLPGWDPGVKELRPWVEVRLS